MLTEICEYLHNWFELRRYIGNISIQGGEAHSEAYGSFGLQAGQYYRVIGSVFNDGVHKYGEAELTQEEDFDGAVWLMSVPAELVTLAATISDWNDKYAGIDSKALSPYQSESFAGYSYSKTASRSSSPYGGDASDWKTLFGSRIQRWKKV